MSDTKDILPWTVQVEQLSDNVFRTVFTVGVQSFVLAYTDDPEEIRHCHLIAKMFATAMKAAGAPEPSNDPNQACELFFNSR